MIIEFRSCETEEELNRLRQDGYSVVSNGTTVKKEYLEDDDLTYAKAGGPPINWTKLAIVDMVSGEEVSNVIEVDADRGWLVRLVCDEFGMAAFSTGEIRTERIFGNFRIVERIK